MSGRSILLYFHKKDNKIDCSNYHVISLLLTSYTFFSNILFSRQNPYIDENIVDYQCGFYCNRSTLDQIFFFFWFHQILEKSWEYNEAVHQLFVAFKKAYDLVRRKVLYNILRVWVPIKQVRVIKIHLNKTYSKNLIGKHYSDKFISRMV
jgi:hypothetical protein